MVTELFKLYPTTLSSIFLFSFGSLMKFGGSTILVLDVKQVSILSFNANC